MKLLQALSEKAKIWFDENLDYEYAPDLYSIPVESRYLPDIINEGLTPAGMIYDVDYTTTPELV